MSNYKRLTNRGDSYCTDCSNIRFCKYGCDEQRRLERLIELEDKIEDRLLIELPVPLGTVVYRLDWDYTDDEYSSKRVWFIDPVRFEIWHLDEWGNGVFETEEEALERLEEERRND